MSKDEFAEYEHGANESHGDDERRDANEDGAAAGDAAADAAAAAAVPRPTPPLPMMRSRVPTPAAPTKAPPLPKTPRLAVALIGRPFALSAGSGGAFGKQGSEWGGLPYSDALLQEGLEHARVIAEKRINGTPRTAEDWLDNNAGSEPRAACEGGRLARECLIEAHLDAVYAATKGYKRFFEAHDLGAEYHRAVRLAVEDSIDKVQFVGRPRAEQLGFDKQETCGASPVRVLCAENRASQRARGAEVFRNCQRRIESLKIHCKAHAGRPRTSCLKLAEHTATRGLSREAMLDILDRGSDGVHRVTFSAAPPCGRGAAPAAARASVVPAAKLAAGAADAVASWTPSMVRKMRTPRALRTPSVRGGLGRRNC